MARKLKSQPQNNILERMLAKQWSRAQRRSVLSTVCSPPPKFKFSMDAIPDAPTAQYPCTYSTHTPLLTP